MDEMADSDGSPFLESSGRGERGNDGEGASLMQGPLARPGEAAPVAPHPPPNRFHLLRGNNPPSGTSHRPAADGGLIPIQAGESPAASPHTVSTRRRLTT
jgi:hypothetical protein